MLVDCYAGGGGASKGFQVGIGAQVNKAINHNREAIDMHKINHPDADHYCESTFDVDPIEVCGGMPVAAMWSSPDCKHFSVAKGGAPLDKTIRGLAWIKLRWMSKKRPLINFLENVTEFLEWGPLGDDNKRIAEREGETFDGFIKTITTGLPRTHPSWNEAISSLCIEDDEIEKQKLVDGFGYDIEWKVLNAADFGAATNRSRIFLVCRVDNQPVVWPEKTHAPRKSELVKNGVLNPWMGAWEVIDCGVP